MCSVQVLLFADVMGRSPSELRPRGGVCRRLFSDAPPADAGEKEAADPGRFLRAMEAELRRRDTERWNFDFQKEKPLPGRYLWLPVNDGLDNMPKIERDTVEVEGGEVVEEKKASPPKTARSSGAGAATQSKITNFLKKRKLIEPEESHKLKVRRLASTLAPSVARPT